MGTTEKGAQEEKRAVASFRISRADLPKLAASLAKSGKLFAPIEGEFEAHSGGPMDLSDNLTMISPVKKFFIPDKSPSFSFDFKSQKILKGGSEGKKILFGVHPLDIKALDTLDAVFSKVPSYIRRRNASTVIGIGDITRSGSSFDLFLHDEGIFLLAVAGSKKGREILSKNKKLFEKCREEIAIGKEDATLLDPGKIREAIRNADKKIWEELARTCLGCGICSYVCPLCYCFECEDVVPLGSKTGERCTRWDSCMLPSFSQVAGGHVFQKSLPERIRNWYYHKFSRATLERGKPDCVGCDRCFHFCPVAINFREVLKNASADKVKD